jgi:hypothetical protein
VKQHLILKAVRWSFSAPAAQKQHSNAMVANAQTLFAKERAKIDRSVEAFMVHKAVKDGATFKILKSVQGANGLVHEPKQKLTRAQQIARKTERHDAIRAEIEAAQLVPEEKPLSFDD